MKATFVILAMLINVLSFAQVADDDNDGIPNNDDACPSVAGTKANNGCPGKGGSTGEEFISSDVFNKLFNAICNNSLTTIASNQKDGNLIVSNLPLIGKQNNLPILFNVFPEGTAEIYCILSTSNADFQKITDEILNKLNASTFCKKMFNNTFPGYKKDTAVLFIPAVANTKYYEMAIEIPNGKSMVVLHILDYNRVISAAEVDNYNKMLSNAPGKSSDTFISDDGFFGIMDMVCKLQYGNLHKPNAKADANGLIETKLPNTGKNRDFPVFYKSFGNDVYSTYAILSAQPNDLDDAANEVLKKLKDKSGHCLVLSEFETKRSKSNDTIFIFNKSWDAFDENKPNIGMAVFKHKTGDGQPLIVWELDASKAIKPRNPNEITKSAGIKDEKFKQEIEYIISEGNNGYINNRLYPLKDDDKWKFKSNLKLDEFEDINISHNSYEGLFNQNFYFSVDANKSFDGNNHAKIAQTFYEKVIAKLDGNLKFYSKEKSETSISNNGIDYKLNENEADKLSIELWSDKEFSIVSLSIQTYGVPLTIENPNSNFGVNETNLEKLKSEIVQKLSVFYNESIAPNGLKKYATAKPREYEDNTTLFSNANDKVSVPYVSGASLLQDKVNKEKHWLILRLEENSSELFDEALEKLVQQVRSKGSNATFSSAAQDNTWKRVVLNNKLVALLSKEEGSWKLTFIQQ